MITDWKAFTQFHNFLVEQESTIISFSKSWSTVILKTVSTWLSVLVYMAMLVTPHWRSQSRTANTHGSGQIPAGKKNIWQCPVKVGGGTLSHNWNKVDSIPISDGKKAFLWTMSCKESSDNGNILESICNSCWSMCSFVSWLIYSDY